MEKRPTRLTRRGSVIAPAPVEVIARPKRRSTISPTKTTAASPEFVGVYIYPKASASSKVSTIEIEELNDGPTIAIRPTRKRRRTTVLATIDDDDSSQSSSNSIDLLNDKPIISAIRSRASTVISAASSYTPQEKVPLSKGKPVNKSVKEKLEKVENLEIESETVMEVTGIVSPSLPDIKRTRNLTLFCHQCKIRKPTTIRITCTNSACTTIWCLLCINKLYLPEGIAPYADSAIILCPVCNSTCHCPRCRKKSSLPVRPKAVKVKVIKESLDYHPSTTIKSRAGRKKAKFTGNLRKKKVSKLVKDFMDTDTESEGDWKDSEGEVEQLKKRVKKWKGKGLEQEQEQWNEEDLDLELETIEDMALLPFNSPPPHRLLSPTPPVELSPTVPTKRIPTKWIEGPERRKRRKMDPTRIQRSPSIDSDSSEYSYQALNVNDSFADSTIEEALDDLTPNALPSSSRKPISLILPESNIYSNSRPGFVSPEDLTSPDLEIEISPNEDMQEEIELPSTEEKFQSNLLNLNDEQLGSVLRRALLGAGSTLDVQSLLGEYIESEPRTPYLPNASTTTLPFFCLEEKDEITLEVLGEENLEEVGWESGCGLSEEDLF